jgi:co-chaperonin GroES (HSP10)
VVQAVNNFVFVVRDEVEENEFIIPDQGRERPHSGHIVSTGALVQDKKIKATKRCLFHKGVGFPVAFEGVEYLVLTSDQVIAII